MNKLTKIDKVDISLKQLSDIDTQNGSYDRVDNIRNNQILTSYVSAERTDQFRFKYLTDILVAGSGIAFSTTNGVTTISATGGGGGASGLPYAVASGTNTYTATISGVTSYTAGDAYIISFTNGNDDDSTININSLGVKTLVKQFDVQLTGGDIVSGQELIIMYDGTNFQTLGVAPNQLFAYVTNDDSVTINKGQPVYAYSSAGNRMSVKLANNTQDSTSAQTVGVVYSTSIAAGQKGFIITQGVVSGLNTAAYSAGAQLYLGSTAGALTATKPSAPNHLVYIGIVERSNAGNGQIYIKPQNGYELEELHDVDLISTPPANNDVLVFDTSTTPDLWKAKSIPTILGYTPESSIEKLVLSGGDVTTTSNTASNITGLVTSTLAANSTYYFSGRFRIGCNNTGGMKFAVTVPTGATPHIAFLAANNTGGTAFAVTTVIAASTLSAVNVNAFSGTGTCIVHGVVVTSATTGTVQFQFASGTSGQTSTIYGSGLSLITVMKVA
jgi:hypothetical protein